VSPDSLWFTTDGTLGTVAGHRVIAVPTVMTLALPRCFGAAQDSYFQTVLVLPCVLDSRP
jgi:hypothetical protein